MIDVSIAARKAVESAHAEKFAASWSQEPGPAGFQRTRKAPVFLSDKNWKTLDSFTALVPEERRAAYRSAVLARLSGSPGDAAVTAAATQAADGFIDTMVLHEHGFVKFNSAGTVRAPRNDRAPTWSSNAITGAGRGR
jgi:hypothetical protein